MRKLKLHAALSWYYRKNYEEEYGEPSNRLTLIKKPDILEEILDDIKVAIVDGEWKDNVDEIRDNLDMDVIVEFSDELFYTLMSIINKKGKKILVIPVHYLHMEDYLNEFTD